MRENRNEVEIDVLGLINHLRKRIALIVAVGVLCTALGFVVTKFLIEPEYTASTRVYVLNRSNENMVVYSDYQISTQMLSDYKVLITGRNVTKQVVEKLGLNMNNNELAEKITVSAPKDTRFVQISVTDTNPERAAQIANMVREIASVQIRNLMDVDAVNLVYEAEVPGTPSSPNIIKNTLFAAVLGVIATVVVLVVVFLLDDTIRTEEDVERHLKLTVMGVIPIAAELESKNQMEAEKKKTARRSKSGANGRDQ